MLRRSASSESIPKRSRSRGSWALVTGPVAGGWAVLFGLLGVIWAAMFWVDRPSPMMGLASVDATIERSDPTTVRSVEALGDALLGPGPAGRRRRLAPIRAERLAFVQAVHAAQWGDPAGAAQPCRVCQTSWGRAAAATRLAIEHKFGAATAYVARLGAQQPTSLPAIWAAAFVAERRGRLGRAERQYQRGQRRYPGFAPMMTGRLRIAIDQGRRGQARHLKAALAEVSPHNPYIDVDLGLPGLDQVSPAGVPFLGGESVSGRSISGGSMSGGSMSGGSMSGGSMSGGSMSEPDRARPPRPAFVRAVAALDRAIAAVDQARIPRAHMWAEHAVALAPRVGPALLVAGILRGVQLDVDGAAGLFDRLAHLPGLTMEYRWALQIGAPDVLNAAGRPDLADRFALRLWPAGGVSKASVGQRRRLSEQSALPRVSLETLDTRDPRVGRAMLRRARTASLLGDDGRAGGMLERLDELDRRPPQAVAVATQLAVRRGDLRGARAAIRSAPDSAGALSGRAWLAYHLGRYDESVAFARQARRAQVGPDRIMTIGALALSLAERGRGADATRVVERARVPLVKLPALRALRLQLAGRLGAGGPWQDAAYAGLMGVDPTSVDRLAALGEVAFWDGRLGAARRLGQASLGACPTYPPAHWLLALVAHIDDDAGRGRDHRRLAWRRVGDQSHRLVRLGDIYMGLQRPARARKAYYRALLRDRQSKAALEGMGRAYLDNDRRRGRRDLRRLLGGFLRRGDRAQAAVALRWLAVLYGVRHGNQHGLDRLDRAQAVGGTSAELLVERGRYHAARGRVRRAARLFGQAVQKDATLAEARAELARVSVELGHLDVARTQLRRYLAMAPPRSEADWARHTLATLDASAP